MNELYTVKEMITWLVKHLQDDGFETMTYSDLFLPARVPVYARKGKEENPELTAELVVDVINSPNTKDFFYTLHVSRTLTEEGKEMEIIDASSASFFRFYFPRAKVYLAYPDYVMKDKEYAKFYALCKKYNIGLFEISRGTDGTGLINRLEIPALPLLPTLYQNCQRAISPISRLLSRGQHRDDVVEEARRELFKELDRHVEETNRYLVYYPEPEYRRREIVGRTEGNISLLLVDKLGESKNLSYKRFLHELSAKYRIRIEDDYDIALELITRLWKYLRLEYPEFQKAFEPVLLLNPRYRDHFLHQLHVFLLGCCIIDEMYHDEPIQAFNKKNSNRIEDIWLLASTYHDYNYNIQNYNEWIAAFFKKSLFLDSNPSALNLDQCYVKEDYMFKTKDLCDSFGLKKVDRTVLLFFYDKIINKKNHGMLGALSLLKLFDQKSFAKAKIKKKGLIQAARAIALHDEDIWKRFSGIDEGIAPGGRGSDEVDRSFCKKNVLKHLHFRDDPVSFLLIFCDTIQEWGRVGRDYEKTGARLDDLGVSNGSVWVNISVNDEDSFDEKKSEIDRVKRFLVDDRFKIKLSSREGLGSNIVERHMEGK